MKILTLITALLLSITLFSQQRSRTYWDNMPSTPIQVNSKKITVGSLVEDVTITPVDMYQVKSNDNMEKGYYEAIHREPKYYSPVVHYGDSVMIVDGVIKKYDKNYVPKYGISVDDRIRVIAEPGHTIDLSGSFPKPVIRDHNNESPEIINLGTGLSLNGNDTNVSTIDSIPTCLGVNIQTGWSIGQLNGHILVTYENETGIGTISGLDRYGNIDRRNIKEQTTALLKQKGIKKIIINLDK